MNVVTDRSASPARRERLLGRWRWVPVVTGIGFTLSWVIGLALPVPNLDVNAPATEVLAKYGGHLAAVQAQFALTEGLPAIGLAMIGLTLALVARRVGSGGRARRARVIAVAGTVAAVISVTQYALGVMLAGWALPDHVAGRISLLWEAINRLDGVKMLTLAVLASAAVALTSPTGPLPRWLRYSSLVLAASITVSGVAYLFLIQALAPVVYVAGVALLVWVTGTGVVLGWVTPGRRVAVGRTSLRTGR